MLSLLLSGAAAAAEWSQFRGPNASGVSNAENLPIEFGPTKNVIWKTPLPPGHSSPVLSKDRIFLTAFEGEKLLMIALDRKTGKELWWREIPRPRKQELHKANSPASGSPVTDGSNVYAFFGDFGLISFNSSGRERWRVPLGPFNNPFGMGASPVLAEGKVLMICDAETGSFFIAVDQNTGQVKWRVERPGFTRGFATPVLYQPPSGGLQAIISGSQQLAAYSVETGKELWWTRGLTWQMKSTPVLDGDKIYVHGWAGGADEGLQENVPAFDEVLKTHDADKDGKLSKQEVPNPRMVKDWDQMDLDRDGGIGSRDWSAYQGRRSVVNAVTAFRLGGEGDMTETARVWRYTKSLPNVPSPLLYDGVLYLLKEGGIFTSLDPKSGAVLKQARLQGALGDYFSSPVSADGKIYTISHECKVSVIQPGPQWEVLAVNDLQDMCNATAVPVGQRIYLRTHTALYAFGIE